MLMISIKERRRELALYSSQHLPMLRMPGPLLRGKYKYIKIEVML